MERVLGRPQNFRFGVLTSITFALVSHTNIIYNAVPAG